jgi:hypothetical protein
VRKPHLRALVPPNKGLQSTVRGVSLRSTPHPAAEAPAVGWSRRERGLAHCVPEAGLAVSFRVRRGLDVTWCESTRIVADPMWRM